MSARPTRWLACVLVSISGVSAGCRRAIPIALAATPAPIGGQASKPLPVAEWTGKPPADWADYNKPVGEGKLEAALLFAETQLEKAKSNKKGEDWTRALLRVAELRWAQGSPEMALRLFQEQPWPDDLLGFTATGLAYAESLSHYMRSYGFKLLDRQRIVSNRKGQAKRLTRPSFSSNQTSTQLPVLWRHSIYRA